ncbi:MAG: hypothetical protein K5779_02690 [Saccharofermentans sp.]|nr:hypothetical protein [Saccharofermentans sp.]
MDDSIFKYISDAVDDNGLLPNDFRLPESKDKQQAMFADGALDGIQIYHMGFSELRKSEIFEMFYLLKIAESGDHTKASEGLSEYCVKHRAVTIIDELQQTIMDHKDELSVQNMAEFAISLIMESSDRELVKVGLIILELVDTTCDPELMDTIRTLGLSDEFTLFSVFIMRNWPDGQMELLDLAKKVRGWGRIHCVKFIEPVNDEITRWLLLNGIDNDVVPDYSALTVFEKTGVEEMLDRTDLEADEIKAVLRIIDSMLSEGPVAGISAVDDPPALLSKVLEFADRIDLDEEEKKIIANVSELNQRYEQE